MALITIATAPKPFANPHIAVIQWNAIQSWLHLGSDVDVLLVGDEPGMTETASELGVRQVKEVALNSLGTPLVSSIFLLLRQSSASPVLVYANADILILPQLVEVIHQITRQKNQFLVVGQRWDLDIRQRMDFSSGWVERLQTELQSHGQLHPRGGSDYFIFPRQCFSNVPDFAIGRAGWDNWMLFYARQEAYPLVDATSALTVIHQNHDYSHLPGGQPHYRLPETDDNTRMAGGRRAIFTLMDAEFSLKNGQLQRLPLDATKILREVEIFPLVRLHWRWLGELFFMFFHPRRALAEWRGRLAYRFRRIRK